MKSQRIFIHFNFKGEDLGICSIFRDTPEFSRLQGKFGELKNFDIIMLESKDEVEEVRVLTGMKLK